MRRSGIKLAAHCCAGFRMTFFVCLSSTPLRLVKAGNSDFIKRVRNVEHGFSCSSVPGGNKNCVQGTGVCLAGVGHIRRENVACGAVTEGSIHNLF